MERIQPLPPVEIDIRRITAVLESTVNEKTWHIAHVPKTSTKACWAQMEVTKKKCTARIVLHGKSTPAPTYSGAWRNMRLNRKEQMQFFFCSDDIERCVRVPVVNGLFHTLILRRGHLSQLFGLSRLEPI